MAGGAGETPLPEQDCLPLTTEEALGLIRSALGKDDCKGLLLAVSGGPDSIAMLGLLGAAKALLPPLAVVTIDHGLRPEATHEAKTVAEFAAALRLSHKTLRWHGPSRGKVSQEAARKGRYALLCGEARLIGASHLVTAHTLDDQAETVLMRLSRGSGTAGLSGMRINIERGSLRHLRPFLGVPKARILASCVENGWLYAKDPTNHDPHYARTRLRTLMPLLAHEGLTAERLGTLAARARRGDEALELVSGRVYEEALSYRAPDGGAVRLKAASLVSEPFEIALRMLRMAIEEMNPGNEAQKEALEDKPIPLAKLETVLRSLRMAITEERPLRTTLAFAIIASGRTDVEIRRAPPRRSQPS